MLSNIYVDNIISGYHSSHQVLQYYKEARHIMTEANFNLRAWASNCHQPQSLAEADIAADSSTTVNVLGLQWNIKMDTLHFAVKTAIPENHTLTEIPQQAVFQPFRLLIPME